MFSPQRATVYTLGHRLTTPLQRSAYGGVIVSDVTTLWQGSISADGHDARGFIDSIRSHRQHQSELTSAPSLFTRRDWLWVRTDGTAAGAIALWQQCSQQQEQFTEHTQLWQHTDAELRVLQQKFSQVDSDEAALHYPWVIPTLNATSRWHSNALVPEDLSFCLHAPDVITFESPRTSHVSVFWFEKVQLQRAALAGVNPPIAAGPPTFTKAFENGREVYTGFGPNMPESMSDLFIDPRSWDRINSWVQSYLTEISRVERGFRFKASNVIGGRTGVDMSIYAMRPEYRRCTWHQGGLVNGVYCATAPVPVESTLPDHHTEIQVFDVYRSAVAYQVPDMEICSMLALYGIRSGTACSATTTLMPNASGAWEHLKVLQDVRTSKLEDYGLFPRLTDTRTTLEYFPARILPKNVAVQERDDGSVKFRGTSDFGARRERIAATMRQHRHDHSASVLADMVTQCNLTKSNAPPGIDSPNGCIPETTLKEITWGKISTFANAVDILLASQLKCDVIIRDFKSWYEEWSRCASEVHLNGQICSSEGINFDTQCIFGQGDCAHLLSRANYAALHVIQHELDAAQAQFDFAGVSDEVRRQMLWYTDYRRAQGYNGRWTTVLPFIDDNTFACISGDGQWTKRVIQVVEQVWRRFHFELSEDKSETNVYDAETWSPVLGRILNLRARTISLPPAKVARYSQDIDSVIDAAHAHPKRLVEKKSCERIFGRLVFACDSGVPTIWRDFLNLVSVVSRSWSQHWLQLTDTAEHLLRQAQWKLHHENASCFTAYTPRPTLDGWPIIVSYTDASRKLDTFEGGYGGWLWVHGVGSTEVFYFYGSWLPDEVEQVDINDLETLVAEYAADLADNIAADLVRDRKTRGGSAHDAESSMVYLAQFGDSQVHFDHVAPGSTANSHGLRFLYRQRAVKDQHRDRVTITQHVLRGRNQPADSLSNGQVEKFKIEMQSLLGPDLKFTQLDVSLADTSLAALIDWKVACSQGKTSS